MRKTNLLLCILLVLSLLTCALAEDGLEAFVPEDVDIALTDSAEPVLTGPTSSGMTARQYFVGSDEPTELIVANTTKVNGNFFCAALGNNTSDIDVRNMLHGYSPIAWTSQLQYIVDPTVVRSYDSVDTELGRTYTFTINKGLTYNDGKTPITARDYVFSILMQSSQAFADIGAANGNFASIVGFEDYSEGKSPYFSGVRLLDEYSYSVTIKAKYIPYFYELSYLHVFPYPRSVLAPGCNVEDDGDGAYMTGPYSAELLQVTIIENYMSKPYLSAGPYKFVDYDPVTGQVDFQKNDFYRGNWEGQVPTIKTISLVPCLPEDMVERLLIGDVDVLNKCVDGQVINEGLAISGGSYSSLNYPRMGYGFCALSCEMGPQQFVAVRQALMCLIDTDELVEEELMGYGVPVYGYYGVGQWMYGAAAGSLIPEGLDEDQLYSWTSSSLDRLDKYDYDVDRALRLLIEDGWTLNAEGKTYVEGTDTLRYKLVDGELMALSFDFALCERNYTAQNVMERYQESLALVGGELVVHEVPFVELLRDYYRENETRLYDMNFMATNFVSVFDLTYVFGDQENNRGEVNTSGIDDQKLAKAALRAHLVEPGDLGTYMERWIEMQERYNEILPSLPLYSNIYFDFFVSELSNYNTNTEQSWPVAILYAHLNGTRTQNPPAYQKD